MELRKLTAEDYDKGFAETLSSLKDCTISREEFEILLESAKSTHTVVAIENDKIIGMGSVFFERKYYNDDSYVAHIEDIVTHKDHQGKGVGKEVMQMLVEIARERGAYKIILDCKEDLEEFYKDCGFSKSGLQMRLNP